MKKLLSALGLLCGLLVVVEPTSAQVWTKIFDGHGTTWAPFTISADGTKLAAIVGYRFISVSTNSGVDFTLSWHGSTNGITSGLASSADGSTLIAASGGAIIISTNAGASWTNVNISYNPNYGTRIASSADGSKLLVAVDYFPQLFFVSDDSGQSWNIITNTSDQGQLAGAICSADGTKMAVICDSGLSTSTNAGADWHLQPVQVVNGSGLASTANGGKLFLLSGTSPSWLFLSTNWGDSWSSNLASFSSGSALACSADGSRLVAVGKVVAINSNTSIYTSEDSGLTWTSNSTPAGTWLLVTSSADGDKLVASKALPFPIIPIGFGGGIYGTQFTPAPRLTLASADNDLKFSWIVPSTNFVLQENLDLGTTSWLTLTNTPTLNLGNLNDEVDISASNSSGFFRLMAQ